MFFVADSGEVDGATFFFRRGEDFRILAGIKFAFGGVRVVYLSCRHDGVFALKNNFVRMKVIVDDKIPYIREAVEALVDEVVYLPGKDFTSAQVKDADALIVRTRTLCNRELLEGSRVQFIATATIGYDHIDAEYCRRAGIVWTNAPGCNSASVAQYVESVLLLLEKERGMKLNESTIGIVGVGNVGRKVAAVAHEYGMRVLLNDLPRQCAEGTTAFTDLATMVRECDVITFHVPLHREGEYKTYHLCDDDFLNSLERKPVLINTSRGEVVETGALRAALHEGKLSAAVIDVWEGEPEVDAGLLDEAWIATPHIAGYSADGKANATRMSLEALCRHFNMPFRGVIEPPAPVNLFVEASSRAEALLKIYNPMEDSRRLKEHPERFEQLRGDYPLRREKEAFKYNSN